MSADSVLLQVLMTIQSRTKFIEGSLEVSFGSAMYEINADNCVAHKLANLIQSDCSILKSTRLAQL